MYACEWNPAAIEGLKRGLEKNRVSSNRCTVIQGDNNKVYCCTVYSQKYLLEFNFTL